MKVHICTPYALDKDLGRAYNEAMALIPEGDFACLLDYDVQLLTPDAGAILHRYAELYPDALLTCYTNRIHESSPQLLFRKISENPDIKFHISIAECQKKWTPAVSQLHRNLSGFLMLLHKDTWKKFPFIEGIGCLGVDTDLWRRMAAAGQPMLIMEGLYVFHQYRIINGIKNKEHLK